MRWRAAPTGRTWRMGATCSAGSGSRPSMLETDRRLAAYVTDRLSEGWAPEQIAGRLRLGVEPGLRGLCAETIYCWIYRAGQKTAKLWRFLTRRHARRRPRHGRASRDTIADKVHISQRTAEADARETVGHWGEARARHGFERRAERSHHLQTRPPGAGAPRAQE
jgi:IS30 family transposase